MELTNEEKTNIINQHIKTSLINLYNLQIALIEENTMDPVNQDNVDSLNKRIEIENAKQNALQDEINSLGA